MTKTFHIGERCRYGTAKILGTTDNSVTIGLCYYKKSEVKEQETFTDTMSLMMWLTDQMDSFHADKIKDAIKKAGINLQVTSIW